MPVNVQENTVVVVNDTTIQVVSVATQGPQGPQGSPGPNLINSTTATPLTGYLKGDGSHVTAQATPIPAGDLPSTVAYKDQNNNFSVNQTINGNAPSQSTLIVKGAAAQSANLFEVQVNSGGLAFSVDQYGVATFGNGQNQNDIAYYALTNTFTDTQSFQASSPTNRPVQICALSGQSGDLLRFKSSTNTTLATFKADASWVPPNIADSSAGNGTVYKSSTTGKLTYKDASGTLTQLTPIPATVAYTDANNNFSTSQTVTGTVTATSFSGLATGLTSIPAANLTGTVADANLSSNVALKNAANTFSATQTANATTGVQQITKAQSGQTVNLQEWQNSTGSARAFVSPNTALTGKDSYYFALKPGTREYTISTWDGAGAMYFGRSDSTQALQFIPNSANVRLACNAGDMYITASATGKLYLIGNEGGGSIDVNIGCRYSDSSTGCGANVRIYSATSQSSPPLAVLAPGGGSSLWSVDKNGGVSLSSMADSTANNSTLYFSTTQNKPCWKDSSGVSNPLY